MELCERFAAMSLTHLEVTTQVDAVLQEPADSMMALKRMERELWFECDGREILDPVEILNESKRRVRAAEKSAHQPELAREVARLMALDRLLRLRRKENNTEIQSVKFWAVIVAINNYPGYEPLRGCLEDARCVKSYLENQLCIPESQITFLTDEGATRNNIWQALWDAIDRSSIGDQVIIYFAGRGTSYRSPRSASEVQAICPVDRGLHDTTEMVQDISCDEVLQLIHKLRNVHTARITLILDCSFNGGDEANRPGDPPLYSSIMARYASPLDTHRNGDEQSIINIIKKALMVLNWTSTQVLTACSSKQTAHERYHWQSSSYRGCFTQALLAVLETKGTSLFDFDEFAHRVGSALKDNMVTQTPVLIGSGLADSWQWG